MNPTPTVAVGPQPSSSIRDLARCLACAASLRGEPYCPRCGRAYPVVDGILDAIGPLSGRNRIVAAFYDGPGWKRFRPWEEGFLILQGGSRRARGEILRHILMPGRDTARALEVGIGDGANLDFLPPGWVVHGVDIARTQLETCLRRHPGMTGRLAQAEAERLPFDDATFDACWSIGGFTYYRDHEAALREMRRVTRPGGPVVVADEVPGLHRAGLGHLLGVPSFDAWWLRLLGLDREFVEMVLDFDVDLEALRARVWPESNRHRIWHGLGYCFVDRTGART
jgi:SAM-dependent methyltransferase